MTAPLVRRHAKCDTLGDKFQAPNLDKGLMSPSRDYEHNSYIGSVGDRMD
jgi:hypothetical protein